MIQRSRSQIELIARMVELTQPFDPTGSWFEVELGADVRAGLPNTSDLLNQLREGANDTMLRDSNFAEETEDGELVASEHLNQHMGSPLIVMRTSAESAPFDAMANGGLMFGRESVIEAALHDYRTVEMLEHSDGRLFVVPGIDLVIDLRQVGLPAICWSGLIEPNRERLQDLERWTGGNRRLLLEGEGSAPCVEIPNTETPTMGETSRAEEGGPSSGTAAPSPATGEGEDRTERRDQASRRLGDLRLTAADCLALSLQGFVRAEFRRNGTWGPYYRLVWRGKSGSIASRYLGRSPETAAAIEAELRELQRPVRLRKQLRQLNVMARQLLKRIKQELSEDLERHGCSYHGLSVRIQRQGLQAFQSERMDGPNRVMSNSEEKDDVGNSSKHPPDRSVECDRRAGCRYPHDAARSVGRRATEGTRTSRGRCLRKADGVSITAGDERTGRIRTGDGSEVGHYGNSQDFGITAPRNHAIRGDYATPSARGETSISGRACPGRNRSCRWSSAGKADLLVGRERKTANSMRNAVRGHARGPPESEVYSTDQQEFRTQQLRCLPRWPASGGCRHAPPLREMPRGSVCSLTKTMSQVWALTGLCVSVLTASLSEGSLSP